MTKDTFSYSKIISYLFGYLKFGSLHNLIIFFFDDHILQWFVVTIAEIVSNLGGMLV